MSALSCGILLYRLSSGEPEFFLVHPGGPFWAKKDLGAWSIPKGIPGENEDLLEAAKREFSEETGFVPVGDFVPVGTVKQKSGKVIHCWAVEGNAPENWVLNCSTSFPLEWPPRSGKYLNFPEVDKAEFFTAVDAKQKIIPAQTEFIERVKAMLRP